MDKQKKKELVTEAEKFLQQLIDNNKLSISDITKLFQKLQKVINKNAKNINDRKKELSDFIVNKNEIKEFLEKDELNYQILTKAAQKISSKSQPQPTQDPEKKGDNKKTQSLFKVEKKDLIQIFNKEEEKYFTENNDKLFLYFEELTKDKLELNHVPFFTMAYLPKEKIIYFYLKSNEKMDLSFSQVDYLCNSSNELFLNIDYFSILENCEVENSREYKNNCIDMAQFEKIIKKIPIIEKNSLKIILVGNDYEKYKKEFKEYCISLKDKVKSVITNNKDFFNEVVL